MHTLPSLFSVAFRIVTDISVSVHGVKTLEVSLHSFLILGIEVSMLSVPPSPVKETSI